ncbi:hypothetical protein B0H16DRAFT_1468078 [Mycena metata]|uniref:F-box domain-containing protein n=1 Tax=Mycena metata TaxID=1033252 RepID=A0AAD7I2F8_9AGAR|nr:hypothetical protein B0H16DRAFT_1468078 [Mycena metata]
MKAILPPEILSIIAIHSFGSFLGNFDKFTVWRLAFCLVCRYWRDVVYASPRAWRCIPVSLYCHAHEIAFILDKAKRVEIHLYINLFPSLRRGARRKGQDPISADVADMVFNLVADHCVQELYLRALEYSSHDHIIGRVTQLNTGRLRRVSLNLGGRRAATTGPNIVGSVEVLRKSGLLQELTLGRTFPPCDVAAVCANLTTLRLVSFSWFHSALWPNLALVLAASKRITFLHLHDVECRQGFPDDVPIPRLDHLTNLVLSSYHPSGLEVAAHIEMPALVNLRLDMYTNRMTKPALEAYVEVCRPFLQRVRMLDVGNFYATTDDVVHFFGAMTSLRVLDLHRAAGSSQSFVDEFWSIADDGLLKLPQLEDIRLGVALSDNERLSMLLSGVGSVDFHLLTRRPVCWGSRSSRISTSVAAELARQRVYLDSSMVDGVMVTTPSSRVHEPFVEERISRAGDFERYL